MLRDMPCGGKGCALARGGGHAHQTPQSWNVVWIAEIDIEILKALSMKFEEKPPFLFSKQIPDEAVPQHMKDYLKRTGRKRCEKK